MAKSISNTNELQVPSLLSIIDSLDKVKYSTYRTAMKIRLIQTLSNSMQGTVIMRNRCYLYFVVHHVEVKDIVDARGKINTPDGMISVRGVESLLSEIFLKKESSENGCLSVELMLNILLKCFDRFVVCQLKVVKVLKNYSSGRSGFLSNQSVLAALLVFSCSTPEEKYRSMSTI